MSIFRKAAVFGDIHFGNKSNGTIHNENCLDYLKWFCKTAQEENCETCIFLGDYFHNRNNTNLVTMSYGLQGLELLAASFEKVIMITGNHDLFYKDTRTISSVSWAKHIDRVEIVNDWVKMDGVIFAPWFVHDEYKKISQSSADYLFCHAEIPRFKMSAGMIMPDVGNIRAEQFQGFGKVYSGHFHARQTQGNITYIGNAFPHNFGDSGDDDRGMMILPYGSEPQFISWPDAPKYRIVKISDLVTDPDRYLPMHGYIKMMLDTSISYEESNYLKETLMQDYELHEMSLVPVKKDLYADDLSPNGNVKFESVDTIVQSQLQDLSSEFYDETILLDIYKNL